MARRLIVLVLVWLVIAAAPARAECLFNVVAPDTAVDIAYDPFSNRPEIESIELILVNAGTSGCELQIEPFVQGRSGRSLPIQAAGLRVDLSTEPPSTQGSRRGFRFVVQEDEEKRITVNLAVRPGANPLPGVYPETIEFRIFEIGGRGQIANPVFVALSIRVRSIAEVNIAGTRGFGNPNRPRGVEIVDFGVLRSGDSRTVFVQVRSNGVYALEVHSENGGELKPDLALSNARIPYDVVLDGEPLALEGTTVLTRPKPRGRGDSLPMLITIGEVGDALAGLYRDRIHVTVRGF